MTVREILVAWLKEHGYDGLCTNNCGCGLDELMCCHGWSPYCVPARKVENCTCYHWGPEPHTCYKEAS